MALIKDEDIQEIKDKASIIDLVSPHVSLKKAGRTYKGLCPFHKEKSPSFTVDPVKQLYHCFGCGEGGDAISFVMKAESMDFNDAVESIARSIGHAVHYESSNQSEEGASVIYEINERAKDYYSQVLMSGAGSKAREYLKTRDFNKEIAIKMDIGYAPESWDLLYKYLSSKGYLEKDMVRAGLLTKNENNKVFDRFRDRVIFPIIDVQGRTVAFGARAFGDAMPKYLNSPESPVYNKSSVLYNIHGAKNNIVKNDYALIVEGYTDVMALAMSGILNVVATCGTALTSEHLKRLSRLSENIVLVFDGDEAGQKAAERGIDLIEQFQLPSQQSLKRIIDNEKINLKVMTLPIKVDPAEYINNHDATDFLKLVDDAKVFTDFYVDRIVEKHDLDDRIQRKKAYLEILEFITLMPSALDQEDYLKKASSIFRSPFEIIQRDFKRHIKNVSRGRSKVGNDLSSNFSQSASRLAEKEMLKCIFQSQKASDYLGKLELSDWQDSDYAQLYLVLKDKLLGKGKISLKKIVSDMDVNMQKVATKLMLETVHSEDIDKHAFDHYLKLKEYYLDRRISELIEDLKDINMEDEKSFKIEKEIKDLQGQKLAIESQFT